MDAVSVGDILDAEARRRGETRGGNESQNLRARSQRRARRVGQFPGLCGDMREVVLTRRRGAAEKDAEVTKAKPESAKPA